MTRFGMFSRLAEWLGAAPGELAWPRGFALPGARGSVPAVYDPQHQLLTVFGPAPIDLKCLPLRAGDRVCLVTRIGAAAAWRALGWRLEATIAGYWSDGMLAEYWASMPDRPPSGPPPQVMPGPQEVPLPRGWVCRPAQVVDAAAITAVLAAVFSDCAVPTDPGVVRYALASETTHGRVIADSAGRLVACAMAEFSSVGGAPEIVDCATLPAFRGQGLMARLVDNLRADLVEVFGQSCCFALAREDEPAMQVVFARRGWEQTGWLVDHFRIEGRWVSAGVWVAPVFN